MACTSTGVRGVGSASLGGRIVVGVRVVGNPGLGLLNIHRPNVCNDGSFRDCLPGLGTGCPSMRVRCCRDGVRNRLVGGLRRMNFACSNMILGTNTCARADVTLRSYVHDVGYPYMRIRVSGIRGHRRFHRRSCVSYTYLKIVYKFNLTSCSLTVTKVLSRGRGKRWSSQGEVSERVRLPAC